MGLHSFGGRLTLLCRLGLFISSMLYFCRADKQAVLFIGLWSQRGRTGCACDVIVIVAHYGWIVAVDVATAVESFSKIKLPVNVLTSSMESYWVVTYRVS